MFRVCIQGRGGHGIVTASELLGVAARVEGRELLVVSSIDGVLATTQSTTTADDVKGAPHGPRPPILLDAIILQDPSLVGSGRVLTQLAPQGWLVVNTRRSPNAVRMAEPRAAVRPGHLATVPADDIVSEYLGRPIPAAALLGAFAALTGEVSVAAVLTAISERFDGRAAVGNRWAAETGHAWVIDHAGDEDAASPPGGYPFETFDSLAARVEIPRDPRGHATGKGRPG